MPSTIDAAIAESAPATVPGQLEYELFMLSGDINKELQKLGNDGWYAFGFLPQSTEATGMQRVLVPCHRPKRLIANPNGNGIALT